MNSTLSLLDYAVEAVSQLLTTSPSQRNHVGNAARATKRRGRAAPVHEDAEAYVNSQRAPHVGGSICALAASSAKAHPSNYFAIPLELEATTF